MSVVRHCDGPDCRFSTPIDEPGAPPVPGLGALAKNGWWRLTDLSDWRDRYFHDVHCLATWVEREHLAALLARKDEV